MVHTIYTKLTAMMSALFLSVLLIGCGPPPDWGPAVRAWIGLHTDLLVDAWGPPDSVYTFRDGRKVLSYTASAVREDTTLLHEPLYPRWHTTYPRWVVTGSRIVDCKAEFRADAKGYIVQANYGGAFEACSKLFRSHNSKR